MNAPFCKIFLHPKLGQIVVLHESESKSITILFRIGEHPLLPSVMIKIQNHYNSLVESQEAFDNATTHGARQAADKIINDAVEAHELAQLANCDDDQETMQ